MSRYMGSDVHGEPPPHLPKTTNGYSRRRFKNPRYPKGVPVAEQKNTSGQRRVRRQQAAKVA